MTTTNLNDRWQRVADITRAPEPKSDVKTPTPAKLQPKESPLAIAGISAEEVKRLTARFKPVTAADKEGIHATADGTALSLWIDVRPDMASRWLKSNFVNRPVSADVVTAYARDMATGKWKTTHQGIAFNDRDELIDGQHRLMAVVKCGKTVRMMVTFGLRAKNDGEEMTTMDCVDRGRTRSVADQLKIQHGLKSGSLIASVSAAAGFLCLGEKLRRLSVGQTLEIYRAFQPGIDHVIMDRSRENGLKSAGVLAAFAFAFATNPTAVKRRFAILNTSEEMADHPLLRALHGFLVSNDAIVEIRSLNRGIAELVAHTLWLDLNGSKADKLEMNPEQWTKALVSFRQAQREAVEKIEALFKLPE